MSPDPTNLLSPWVPSGFDEFWTGLVSESERDPLRSFSLTQVESTATHRISTVDFPSISGLMLYGWIAEPIQDPKPASAFLWVPPYSRWSMLPNEYGTRPGYVSMSFNLFGESAFHQESYSPSRGYFAQGIESKETWVFRRIFIDCMRAVRALSQLPSVDATKIGAMGMSQGAGIAVWLGAYCPLIRAVVADMPFLSGMQWVLAHEIHRYPLKELTDWMDGDSRRRQIMLETISFFDSINVATRCNVSTMVSAGRKDPAVKAVQARALYNALPGKKEFIELDWGHDWHPSMIARNQKWLDESL